MKHTIHRLFSNLSAKTIATLRPSIPMSVETSFAIEHNTHDFYMRTNEGRNLIDLVNADMGQYTFHNMFAFPCQKVVDQNNSYAAWYLLVNEVWRSRRMVELESAANNDTLRLLNTMFSKRLALSHKLELALK